MVTKLSDEFSMRIIGSPFYDPDNKIPYLLSKRENREHLNRLTPITSEATIITSKLSLKPLKNIFEIIAGDKVNVVAVEKEIGDLITSEDLVEINLDEVKSRVIIPGGALVHDQVVHEIFNDDGEKRKVIRGPLSLYYVDFDMSNKEKLLTYELRSFNALIGKINNC